MKKLGLTLLALCAALLIAEGCSSDSPAQVVKRYVEATYSWDYSKAYELISEADKKIQTLEEYKESRGSVDPVIGERARLLVPYIRYETPEVSLDGDKATVKIAGHLPNWSALSFEKDVKRKLRELGRSGSLPMVEAQETFRLVKEKEKWGVFLNWAEAVTVTFEAGVKNDLPWEFGVKQGRVIALPGETLTISYWAKNTSDREITGKATHIIEPKESRKYLEVIQCFCLFEETLKAGDGKEMPLVLRVSWDAPEEVKSYRVRYEFYPVDSFPEGADEDWEEGSF